MDDILVEIYDMIEKEINYWVRVIFTEDNIDNLLFDINN
jgi:hypothetical protein